jgi:hypothetical protein
MYVHKHKIFLTLSLCAASLVFAAPAADLPFGAWRRASETPVMSPQGAGWESAGTFNPAVVKTAEDKFVMLYRAQDEAGTSRIGYAESTDGIHFVRWAQPVLYPEADYGIQQEGCAALPGHVEGPDSLGSQGSNSARVQRELERGVDQVRRDRAGKN